MSISGSFLMNLSNYKRNRALLPREIAKQQAQREQTHPVCLNAVEKYEKVNNVNIQNDYETTNKKLTDKKKGNLFFMFCKCIKFQENKLKIVQNSF